MRRPLIERLTRDIFTFTIRTLKYRRLVESEVLLQVLRKACMTEIVFKRNYFKDKYVYCSFPKPSLDKIISYKYSLVKYFIFFSIISKTLVCYVYFSIIIAAVLFKENILVIEG